MKNTPPILVSACLAGEACRYDGTAAPHPVVVEWLARGCCVPVCPEMLGGLPCPRPPGELRGGRVLGRDGADYTEAYMRGAAEALQRGLAAGCCEAVLKQRSPSCGVGSVYDGTFTRQLVPGNGIFAQTLIDAGFTVRSEEDL